MKAIELAKILLDYPDAEVLVLNSNGELIDNTKTIVYEEGECVDEGTGCSQSAFVDISTDDIDSWPIANKLVIFLG